MKTFNRYSAFALLLALFFAACEPDPDENVRSFRFNARIEQPAANDGTKVHLLDERYIYWEVGDRISIGSDQNNCEGNKDNTFTARLINVGDLPDNDDNFGAFNGVFVTTMDWGSQYFLGLHPQNDKNIITHGSGNSFSTIKVCLPAVQPLRNDLTFAKQVLPMVAWYGGEWNSDETAFNLDFHSLASIVRLQIYNATNADVNLDSIVITSRDSGRQLSGLFQVHGSSYRTDDPYLDALAAAADINRRIVFRNTVDGDPAPLALTLKPAGGAPADVDTAHLRSFYLVLPAYKGRHDSTTFHLTMTAYSGGRTATRNFNVNTRRNGMTFLPAIAIDNWSTGHSVVGLTGNGTRQRPFKVYSLEDLQKVRDAYNSADASSPRYINNIKIDTGTYICVMRSDIVLTKTNWVAPIRNFVGHFYQLNHQSHPGIVDSSDVPLFENILEGGKVEGITLKCGVTYNATNTTGLSPFCQNNAGLIKDCIITPIPGNSKKILSIFSPLAGICVTNSGTIEGCRFEANAEVQSGQNFAGICLHNQSGGKVIGCQAASMMTATSTGLLAGIVYENLGGAIVRDCYFAANITGGNGHWAGIVYANSGTVEHCYFSSTGTIYTTGTLGGIVRNNLAGTVNYCWLAGTLKGSTVGGIVDSLVDGTVINCFNQPGTSSVNILSTGRENVAGGIAAYLKGGNIKNSFVDDLYLNRDSGSDLVGGIVGKILGGTVDNCYDYEDYHIFYGAKSGGTITNSHLVDGSQTDVATVSSTTANAFVTLQSTLNANKPSGSPTAQSWTGAVTNTTPPSLAPYTYTSSKHRRK